MAAVTPPVAAPAAGEGHDHFVRQATALSWRAVVRFARQPSSWIPATIFPLLLVAVNSSAMARVATLPGVIPPGTTFLMYLLPAAIVQGVMFGGINGGSELATDIQTGFFDRLVSSPVSRPAILVGRLGGAMAFGAVQAVFFQAVLWPFGADVEGGIPGRLVLVVVAVLLSLGLGAIAAGLAARTGQAEAVQGFFPLIFILLFLSSAFFPTQLMSGLYQKIAEANPLTWLIDGMRYQVLYGFSWSEAATSIGVCLAICVIGLAFAITQVRRRLRVAS
jgi:ABC-2 type transport system permease protein